MTKPVGPYTPVVRAGDLLFVSGQVGLVDGALAEGGFDAQAVQGLANLRSQLEANGACLDNVVKTTVFLTDIGDYSAMNELYCEAFGDHRPARSCVAVAALPIGAVFEVEAIAHVG
ncbi:MAG: Rid family detoxifying hydrolase [Actinomycetota bacterium]|nr:Rid family detoxifying hydrolase [Actinomycetota bacterium]MEC9395540.1 Rid family detoxifying hydrolase [Actinomycetota bacterium]MEC9468035.1 Rid family detoxifying hydrolase [Actinomycetota bacterium]MED6328072.1 Rid family detoxifying hydrolase [Actinomycetota bacterium]MEE2957877.1 Rid family detoxifying hydrolase [Actinomycetota bacterium]